VDSTLIFKDLVVSSTTAAADEKILQEILENSSKIPRKFLENSPKIHQISALQITQT